MTYRGIVQGQRIELDARLPLPDGTRVSVDVHPEVSPRKGSPAAVLRLAGTLTDEEAEAISRGAQACRRIDLSLWDRS